MKPLLLERRAFLAGAGLAWLGGLTPANAEKLSAAEVLFAAAYKDRQGGYGISILDGDDAIVSSHPLPGRGHGFAARPNARWLVAFARRPGNFALALDRWKAAEPQLFHTPHNRHFYGHGVFSADGRLLYAAENAYETGDGVIGIYDGTDGFKRLGEFATGGIGPHEIVLMPDGKTLCVANGGIRTHPDQGRQKLNLPTMAPSVVLIDIATGSLLSFHVLASRLHRLSLRHVAVDARSQVWICSRALRSCSCSRLPGSRTRGFRRSNSMVPPPQPLASMQAPSPLAMMAPHSRSHPQRRAWLSPSTRRRSVH